MDYWQEVLLGGEGAAPVFDLEPHLEDLDLRRCLFETAAWGLYDEEGVFSFERAEGLLQGRLRQLDLEPVQIDPSTDYDWMVQHPRDALFQHSHQNAWHFMYLALASKRGCGRLPPSWISVPAYRMGTTTTTHRASRTARPTSPGGITGTWPPVCATLSFPTPSWPIIPRYRQAHTG
jgi:hypothetical protein